jgi:uncharacterized Ntn-hydrolase superfamily protein
MTKRIFSFLIFFTINMNLILSGQTFFSDPFSHTFSIVARDTLTGEMGVAVQSHWFNVGAIVPWGEAGVGVVATQSFVNVSFGLRGLELLRKGLAPSEAIDSLLSDDDGRDLRQVAILDSKGRVASYTGKNCVPAAGNIVGDNFSAQANLMLNEKVWPAMADAFKKTTGRLAERMIAALEAGQKAGGDIRGKQSAALMVFKGQPTDKPWEGKLIDLRVEDNPEPIKELKRVLKVHRAYEHMNNGDLAVENGDMKKAMKEYSAAEEMFPDNEEMKYWHAVTLANNGKVDESLPIFKEVFAANGNWKILTPRLIQVGLLKVDENSLEKIISLK